MIGRDRQIKIVYSNRISNFTYDYERNMYATLTFIVITILRNDKRYTHCHIHYEKYI